MPDFTDEELLQTIESGEADRIEFKESLSGSAAEQNQGSHLCICQRSAIAMKSRVLFS